MAAEIRCVTIGDRRVEYELHRKKVKNLNLRIRADGSVYVSASPRVSIGAIERFMQSKAGLILSAVDRARANAAPLPEYTEEECRAALSASLERVYPLIRPYGVKMPELRLRSMTSRWGSCSYTAGRITLNKRLAAYPKEAVDMVTLHELCHFMHPNHSKEFYALMTELMPDWKQRKLLLSEKQGTGKTTE